MPCLRCAACIPVGSPGTCSNEPAHTISPRPLARLQHADWERGEHLQSFVTLAWPTFNRMICKCVTFSLGAAGVQMFSVIVAAIGPGRRRRRVVALRVGCCIIVLH